MGQRDYKSGQLLGLQSGTEELHIRATFGITKWDRAMTNQGSSRDYKVGQKDDQSGQFWGLTKWGRGITNRGSFWEYKVGQGNYKSGRL